jgi:uncharacterized protein (DUF362 family)/Pyruvate/2-oxoacid:ferredoxin oxidoreductase delta subunit
MAGFVRPGEKILVKPNLLGAWSPEKRVTTDPAIVYGVLKLVKEAGGIPFVADSPALGSFKKVAARTGMEEICSELGVDLVELSDPTPVKTNEKSGFRRLELGSQVLEADALINLPKLKTHGQMLMTLGVKNLFGTVVGHRKAEWHHMAGVDRNTFASLLLDIYAAVKPRVTILDGIWAMEGHGPSNGSPRRLNLIAAATDAVALDVSVCSLLGIPLKGFPLYREARKRRIGETDLSRIRLEGDDPRKWKGVELSVPRLDSMGILPGQFDWLTRRFLVSRPVLEKKACRECGLCMEICPVKAVVRNGERLVFDYDKCIRCYCCQEICSSNAIRFKKGLLVKTLTFMNR